MPFHCKIFGAGGGKQWSQLNIEKAKGRVDFRKGRERGAQIEPSLSLIWPLWEFIMEIL